VQSGSGALSSRPGRESLRGVPLPIACRAGATDLALIGEVVAIPADSGRLLEEQPAVGAGHVVAEHRERSTGAWPAAAVDENTGHADDDRGD
jgi:hypothetical protein